MTSKLIETETFAMKTEKTHMMCSCNETERITLGKT